MFNLNNVQFNNLFAFINAVDSVLNIPGQLEAARASFAREGWVADHFAKELMAPYAKNALSFYNNYHVQGVISVIKWLTKIAFWSAVLLVVFTLEEGVQKRGLPLAIKALRNLWGWIYCNLIVEESCDGLPSLRFVEEVQDDFVVYIPETKTEDPWFSGEAPQPHTNQFSFSEPVAQALTLPTTKIAGLLPAAKEEVCEEPQEDLWEGAYPSCVLKQFSFAESQGAIALLPAAQPKLKFTLEYLESLKPVEELRKLARLNGVIGCSRMNRKKLIEKLSQVTTK